MTPNVCRISAELRPNSLMLPSRTEPNIRPNSSAELRPISSSQYWRCASNCECWRWRRYRLPAEGVLVTVCVEGWRRVTSTPSAGSQYLHHLQHTQLLAHLQQAVNTSVTLQHTQLLAHLQQLAGLGTVKIFFQDEKIYQKSGHFQDMCYLYNPRQFTHMKSHYGLVDL